MNHDHSRAQALMCGVVAVIGLVLATGACAPRVETRGNALDPYRISEIKPGVHTRAQVAQILGTPSSTGTFDENTWYYISKRTSTFAFLEPKVLEEKVVVVRFDKSGVVSEIKTFDGDRARDVKPVARQTPALGKEPTILGQLYKTLIKGPGGALGGTASNEGFVR